ncbi:ribbon-helix-helix domain [Sulfolobales Beppu virus 1]|nr:ribbon-helix-helix domain [Sulfolobales Beppu virus 1]
MVSVNRDIYNKLRLLAKIKGVPLINFVENEINNILNELDNIKAYQKGKDIPLPGELEHRLKEVSERLHIPRSAIIYTAILLPLLNADFDELKEYSYKRINIPLDHEYSIKLMALSSRLKKTPNEIISWCIKNYKEYIPVHSKKRRNEVVFSVLIPIQLYYQIKGKYKFTDIVCTCIDKLSF